MAVKTAGWHHRAPAADGEVYLDDQELERAALEFCRTRLPHFSERSLVTRAGYTQHYAFFVCTGPGPEGVTHHSRIALSRRDGLPCSLMVRYELPPPPPLTPIAVTPERAAALAEVFVQERCNGAAYVVGELTTSSRLAGWGVPVYPVGISERPLEVWVLAINATTGEILDDMLPPAHLRNPAG